MEQNKMDRAFAEKYLPAVYQTALDRVGDPAIAKITVKRVFVKVQEAMTSGNMPAKEVLEAWLAFLTQDEAASMMKQAAQTPAMRPAPPREQPRRDIIQRDTEVIFQPQKHPLRVLCIILFGLLILVNLWFIYGLLAGRGLLPKVDLGYAWFDMTFVKLFGL